MESSSKKQTESTGADVSENLPETSSDSLTPDQPKEHDQRISAPEEQGGFENSIEPTRYGDWEIAGRCIDF